MAKIYTRTGDRGETSIFGGGRLRKDDHRIETIGSIDEVNTVIGVVRVELGRSGISPIGFDDLLAKIQNQLFDLGAELAMPSAAQCGATRISEADVQALESAIDTYEAQLAPLRAFILPGGSPASAQLHVARCVCRRAERRLVELAAGTAVLGDVICYVNRLSDLLFVLARAANHANRVTDVLWEQGAVGSKAAGT